jgi:gliding motility-associated-like protein
MSTFLNRTLFFCFYLCCNLSVQCQDKALYKLNPQQLDSLIFMEKLPQNRLLNRPGFPEKYNRINELQIQISPVPKLNSNSLQSSTCYDSSGRFFLRKDSVHFYVNGVSKTANGMLLIAGSYSDYTSGTTRNTAYILKSDESGNVIWAKKYDSLNHIEFSTIYYHKAMELQNGNLILVGKTNNLVTENEDLLVTKTDNTGNIIWSKTYKSVVWTHGSGSADYYYVEQMKEDPLTGDIYLTGPHWALGRNITSLDQNNGSILWSKRYNPVNGNYSESVFGIDILPAELRSFGLIRGGTATWIGIYRINKTTGDTIATKYFNISDPQSANLSFLGTDPLCKLNNGHYRISGLCYGYFGTAPRYQGAVCDFDDNLNFVKAFCVRNNQEFTVHTNNFSLFPDNTGLFAMARYSAANTMDHYYLQFDDMTILKERKKQYTNGLVSSENYAVKHSSGADLMIRLLGNNGPGSQMEFLKLQTSDTSSTCTGVNEPLSFIQPFNYVQTNLGLAAIIPGDFVESSNKTITAQSFSTEYVPGCQSTSFCDTLKLIASADTLCGSAPLLLIAHKNQECGSNVNFTYDPTYVQSFIQINDSTYQVIFNGAWQGYIYAGLQSCATFTDSVPVVVFASLPNVNLGIDTSICPGNTIILDARPGYASYLWSSGGTGSTITVAIPGTYYVDVVDGCGNSSSDTVIVSVAPPIAFNIGADRIKCNADTVHVNAPEGFLNYSWGPAYNINSLTAQNVIVQPLVDTIYFVRAEKTSGCFAYDSIKIKVNHSAPINLGSDKSFCSGDSAVLNAGPGFVQYAWNTGAISQQVSVFTTGNYIAVGTDLNGCRSTDTLQVTNVYALPAINLDKGSSICFGDIKTLDAGTGYSSYLWNTAATGSTINVSAIGKYWVVVKNVNNCIGSDTTEIKNIDPLAANFLPADTAICTYSTMQIIPAGNYVQYAWNNGATSSSITVSGPGLYWLQVTDNKNCVGKDSIRVLAKECYRGFYIPGAFTPNHDAKNEIFKPQIFGNVSNYNFMIFNRYGKVVFNSTDLKAGWDGTFKGRDADIGAYTWVCTFKLNSLQTTEKGTVLLIR